MLKANSEAIRPLHGDVWFPGRMMGGLVVAPLSARALEIAKSRDDQLLGLLCDLPESDRELSFSDLIDRKSAVDDSAAGCNAVAAHEGETKLAVDAKERSRRMRSSRSSFSGKSDGVLLNLYLPASLARSLTASRPSRASFRSGSTSPSNKRDWDDTNVGCWSVLMDRSKGKSRRKLEDMKCGCQICSH